MRNNLILFRICTYTFLLILNIFLLCFTTIASEENLNVTGYGRKANIIEEYYALQELLNEGVITYTEYESKLSELMSDRKPGGIKAKKTKSVDLQKKDTFTIESVDLEKKDTFTKEDLVADSKDLYIKYQGTEFLTFEELKSLFYNPSPEGYLKEKVDKFFKTPIINNKAFYDGVEPHRPFDPRIGPFLRVASWNIEKSINIKDAIAVFKSNYELLNRIDPSKLNGSRNIDTIIDQRKKLVQSDIIVLQEMEIGMKRSGYLNAAKELADALEMNYTYAPQYLEVDPVQLGLEKIYSEEGQLDEEATKYYLENKELYKGVFGSAVLSRYPIKNVILCPLKNQGYDWYHGEKPKSTYVEKTRRIGSKVVFKNEITREMKIGGRHFFRVDLEVPDIPEKTLTIINIHLEIKCLPYAREQQMKEVLSYIKDIKNPVVVLGDFNSAPADLSPTSASRIAKRGIKNPSNWLSTAVTTFTGAGLFINTTRGITNAVKNLQNPLARDIPVVAPNKVRSMFQAIEDFRFIDGGAFDFRGDAERSVNGKKGKLANSNQRDLKAFKTTFSVKRVIAKVIGTYRLDWIFVKSYLKDPLDPEGPYRLAPHFGETLAELNDSLFVKISDHNPNVADLPLFEPSIYLSQSQE